MQIMLSGEVRCEQCDWVLGGLVPEPDDNTFRAVRNHVALTNHQVFYELAVELYKPIAALDDSGV